MRRPVRTAAAALAAERLHRRFPFADATEILLVVGPEGGLDAGEVADLTALGANSVVLGPEVLRTSTAAAVALGAIGVLTRFALAKYLESPLYTGRPPAAVPVASSAARVWKQAGS